MDEFCTVINCEEKDKGKGLYIASIFLFIPALGMGISAIFNASAEAGIGFLVFFVFSLLLYVLGSFQYKKHRQLGKTPLTLVPSFCTLGAKASGSISIEREQFHKVKNLSLTSWKSSPAGSDRGSLRYDVIWETTIEPSIEFIKSKTILDFEFTIPTEKKPTDERGTSRNKFYWEISFEFVESMDSIKRTWKIPVKI